MTTRSEDIAWAAGLFEGEGTIVISKCGNGEQKRLVASLRMVDFDVVERFANIIGIGRLGFVRRQKENYKHQRRWDATSNSDVLNLIILLMPYMGMRRKKQMMDILVFVREKYGVKA